MDGLLSVSAKLQRDSGNIIKTEQFLGIPLVIITLALVHNSKSKSAKELSNYTFYILFETFSIYFLVKFHANDSSAMCTYNYLNFMIKHKMYRGV